MNTENITETDFEILNFIRKNQPVSIEDMRKSLPKIEGLEYRISYLCAPECQSFETGSFRSQINRISYICENIVHENNVIKKLGTYSITDYGRKVLQDYKVYMRRRTWEMWLKNAWIPILVAFFTTLLTNYLIPKLPTLLEWLNHTLHAPL